LGLGASIGPNNKIENEKFTNFFSWSAISVLGAKYLKTYNIQLYLLE